MKKLHETKERVKQKWAEDADFRAAVTALSAGASVFVFFILAAVKDHKRYEARLEIFSFGKDSPIKIKATPSEAAAYNRFTKWLIQVEKAVHEPENWFHFDPTWMHIQQNDRETWEQLGRRINKAVENFDPEEISDKIVDNFLVKN